MLLADYSGCYLRRLPWFLCVLHQMLAPRRTRSVGEAAVGGGRDLSFTKVFSHNSWLGEICRGAPQACHSQEDSAKVPLETKRLAV